MSSENQLKQLKSNLEIIFPTTGLEEKLKYSNEAKVPLRVKLGFDPTAPDLHLGHFVVLKKIREFQDFGHKVLIIIGDFTAAIGDPTGRNKTRPPLTPEAIQANAATYLDQLGKVIDLSKAEVQFNSTWFNQLSFRDVIALLSKVTVSQILQREDFSNRYKENIPIGFHELVYPIIQGYDSYMIQADVELGGTDQLFNCLVGRDIQSSFQKRQQIVACVPILRGTDGVQKMSKSLGNYVGLTDAPENMFGKIMSIPDNLIEEYVRLVSNFSLEKKASIQKALADQSVNPMEMKKEVAANIVEQFYGKEAAVAAGEHFYKQVQSRDHELIEFAPHSLSALNLTLPGLTVLSLCAALMPDKSKGELRRVIQGGGVVLNSEKVLDPNVVIETLTKENFKIKVGKRAYFEILI